MVNVIYCKQYNIILHYGVYTVNLVKYVNIVWNILRNKKMKERRDYMWIIYALLSALFAALTSILAKIGIENVNSNLATAIRTVVVLVMAWGIVFILNLHLPHPLQNKFHFAFHV